MKEEESFAVKYLEYLDKEDRGETFNDFFDWIGLPIEYRKDFLIGLIVEQAQKICQKEVLNHDQESS